MKDLDNNCFSIIRIKEWREHLGLLILLLKACSVKSAVYIMIEPVLLLVLKKLEVLRKSFSLSVYEEAYPLSNSDFSARSF